jgi:hypothetical protein
MLAVLLKQPSGSCSGAIRKDRKVTDIETSQFINIDWQQTLRNGQASQRFEPPEVILERAAS